MSDLVPVLSIIVPVYNGESYISRCLESVTSGCFEDFEIVVVDDGSTDGTLRLTEEFASRDKRIKVFSQSNGGLSVARNTGVTKSSGDYLLFLDVDDKLDMSELAKVMNIVREKSLDLLVYDFLVVETDEIKLNDRQKFYYCRTTEPTKEPVTVTQLYLSFHLSKSFIASACQNILRKEALQKAGLSFVPGLLHEDETFSVELFHSLEFSRCMYVPSLVYLRFMTDGSIMNSRWTVRNTWGYLLAFLKLFPYLIMSPWTRDDLYSRGRHMYGLLRRVLITIYLIVLKRGKM